jgi:hypothetical protein
MKIKLHRKIKLAKKSSLLKHHCGIAANEGQKHPRRATVVGLGRYGDHPIWQDGAQQLKHLIIPELRIKSSKYLLKIPFKVMFLIKWFYVYHATEEPS